MQHKTRSAQQKMPLAKRQPTKPQRLLRLPWRFKLRHLTRSLTQELLRPRRTPEWYALAVELAGYVPGLKAAAEIAGAGLALGKRDYLALGLVLTTLLTGTGEWIIVIQVIRKGHKLIEALAPASWAAPSAWRKPLNHNFATP